MASNLTGLRKSRRFRFGSRELIISVTVGAIIIHYGMFLFFPILYGLYGSFFDWNITTSNFKFVGIDNYARKLQDPVFWKSLFNNVYFTFFSVLLVTVLSLIIALSIHSVKRFKTFFRTVYFMPVVTSLVAASFVWKWMYDPTMGLFNQILDMFNLPHVEWLTDKHTAMPSIILMTVWKDAGFAIVLYMVGLLNIPSSLFESAKIDGANSRAIFWNITLPMLRSTTFFVVVTNIIGYLQVFIPIYLMTKGGPGTSTFTTSFMIYDAAFDYYNFGEASTISFLLFFVILIVTFAQTALTKRRGGFDQ
ncbi:sugar ABC transporter permease [Cohnella pontilimi]|uniref:Sugar ABC transporter permease n=1 Tax=Cohnella pontilimi TaxID=2564100 RepID=A0A4U0FDU2_9BACL|nr:sugar ABC transporter permease [Cohnella pontilimi]TJY42424.1 sugar ABC transporter permease [Cohnella pontilimi]